MVERDGPPADAANQLAVVRRHDDGRAAGVGLAEQIHDFEREIGIEIARRLVGQHELRFVDERAGDRDALLLAAGQFFRKRVLPMLEPDPLQRLERLALLQDRRHPEHAHDERDVLKDRHPRDEAEVLKDEPDGATVRLHLRRPKRGEIASGHHQIAFAR